MSKRVKTRVGKYLALMCIGFFGQGHAFGYDCNSDCQAESRFRYPCPTFSNPGRKCTGENPVKRGACEVDKAASCAKIKDMASQARRDFQKAFQNAVQSKIAAIDGVLSIYRIGIQALRQSLVAIKPVYLQVSAPKLVTPKITCPPTNLPNLRKIWEAARKAGGDLSAESKRFGGTVARGWKKAGKDLKQEGDRFARRWKGEDQDVCDKPGTLTAMEICWRERNDKMQGEIDAERSAFVREIKRKIEEAIREAGAGGNAP